MSDDAERLDPNNGLLLVANLDALFDAGLITFGESGAMQVASRVGGKERQTLGLTGGLSRAPDSRLALYLAHHRDHVFSP